MNSSVTWDSATSVISSLCLEIRPSSRSNGPSKTARCTSNPAGPLPWGASLPGSAATARLTRLHLPAATSRRIPQSPSQQARLSVRVEIGEQHGNSLTHQPATVCRDPVTAQRQPGPLEIEELGRGQVDGDLLRMGLTAAGWPPAVGVGADGSRAEQFGDARQAYPPGAGSAWPACRHRCRTSLASTR